MNVVLAWPNSGLSPNKRLHWAPVAKLKAEARTEANWQTKATIPFKARQALAQGEEPIPMRVTFYPPDKRHRDDDNIIASFKSSRDGLADGLGVNDRRFRPTYVIGEPAKPGRVVVEIIPCHDVQNCTADATIAGDSCYGKTAPRDACNAPREPDHNRLDTGGD